VYVVEIFCGMHIMYSVICISYTLSYAYHILCHMHIIYSVICILYTLSYAHYILCHMHIIYSVICILYTLPYAYYILCHMHIIYSVVCTLFIFLSYSMDVAAAKFFRKIFAPAAVYQFNPSDQSMLDLSRSQRESSSPYLQSLLTHWLRERIIFSKLMFK